eukprot:g3049.t1
MKQRSETARFFLSQSGLFPQTQQRVQVNEKNSKPFPSLKVLNQNRGVEDSDEQERKAPSRGSSVNNTPQLTIPGKTLPSPHFGSFTGINVEDSPSFQFDDQIDPFTNTKKNSAPWETTPNTYMGSKLTYAQKGANQPVNNIFSDNELPLDPLFDELKGFGDLHVDNNAARRNRYQASPVLAVAQRLNKFRNRNPQNPNLNLAPNSGTFSNRQLHTRPNVNADPNPFLFQRSPATRYQQLKRKGNPMKSPGFVHRTNFLLESMAADGKIADLQMLLGAKSPSLKKRTIGETKTKRAADVGSKGSQGSSSQSKAQQVSMSPKTLNYWRQKMAASTFKIFRDAVPADAKTGLPPTWRVNRRLREGGSFVCYYFSPNGTRYRSLKTAIRSLHERKGAKFQKPVTSYRYHRTQNEVATLPAYKSKQAKKKKKKNKR